MTVQQYCKANMNKDSETVLVVFVLCGSGRISLTCKLNVEELCFVCGLEPEPHHILNCVYVSRRNGNSRPNEIVE